jgi:DNA-nicking Smr family endonuclease
MMPLTSDDLGLWRRAMRDVIPLRGRTPPPDGADEPQPPRRGRSAGTDIATGGMPAPRSQSPPQPPPKPLDAFAGLDRASAERLKRGRYPIEARLDLHGMTQAQAHRALNGFVAGSRAMGRRCVLVITGHGRSSGGILRQSVPRWLHEPDLRRHLLAISPARPHDGGAGALYLLLRKAA